MIYSENKISPRIAATNVTDSLEITLTFPSFPISPVVYKEVDGVWKEVYPTNECDGITDISLNTTDNTLTFTIADNSECDGDPADGAIYDPVVLGEETSSSVVFGDESNSSGSSSSSSDSSESTSESTTTDTTTAGGGGGDFFIAIAGFLLLVAGFYRKYRFHKAVNRK